MITSNITMFNIIKYRLKNTFKNVFSNSKGPELQIGEPPIDIPNRNNLFLIQ